jgi:hypothetical protein
MKTLNQILSESDFSDPKSPAAKAFVDKHIVQKTDYPKKPKGGSNDEIFKGSKQKKAKHRGDLTPEEEKAVYERTLTKTEARRKETIVKGMKKHSQDFVKRYGKDAESVMHGVATNQAKDEEFAEDQDIVENIIETMQKVLDTEKEHSFTFKNGDVLDIDADTAERLMSVYEDLNDDNRDMFVSSLERNQNHFMKLLDFSTTVGV